MQGTATFCVGGQFFTTSRDTLNQEPGCRLALVLRGVLPAQVDSQGVFFIDRDPKYFQLLLNFLRDGWCRLPPSPEECQELLHEVCFYKVCMHACASLRTFNASPINDAHVMPDQLVRMHTCLHCVCVMNCTCKKYLLCIFLPAKPWRRRLVPGSYLADAFLEQCLSMRCGRRCTHWKISILRTGTPQLITAHHSTACNIRACIRACSWVPWSRGSGCRCVHRPHHMVALSRGWHAQRWPIQAALAGACCTLYHRHMRRCQCHQVCVSMLWLARHTRPPHVNM